VRGWIAGPCGVAGGQRAKGGVAGSGEPRTAVRGAEGLGRQCGRRAAAGRGARVVAREAEVVRVAACGAKNEDGGAGV